MQDNSLVCDDIHRIDVNLHLLCYLLHSHAHLSDFILYSTQHLSPCPMPFLCSKFLSAQNLCQPPVKYQGRPPRSVLLLLEVGLALSSFMPQTIRSQINASFKTPNSHLAALLCKSVTYASIESLLCTADW